MIDIIGVGVWEDVYNSRDDWQPYPAPYPMSTIKAPKGEDSYFIILMRDGSVRKYVRWGIPSRKPEDKGKFWEPVAFIEFATHKEAQAAINVIKGGNDD